MVEKRSDKKLEIKRKSLKGEDGYRVFSIRIKEEIVEEINQLSEKSGRSRNELIGIMLEFAINNCKIVS